MPRYRYKCKECDDEHIMFHLFDEIPELNCKKCNSPNSLAKVLTIPLHFKKNTKPLDGPIGELTEEYIEKNREILEQEKQKSMEETYEPS